jgi:transposase
MDVLIERCAGLDVHKRSVTACVRVLGKKGRVASETRLFGTMTEDLLEMSDWLAGQGVTDAAMESTGVFWKPIFNLLEERFRIMLCNARKIKNVPGRKTDVRDAEWIAQLLQHGLLTGSFIPPRPQRDLRDLTRHRSQLVSERTREVNRVQKVLEDANVKLASVATDVLGVSGRAMLRALIRGEADSRELAKLARGRLKAKTAELEKALLGHVSDHHRFLLSEHLDHVEYLERKVEGFTERIDRLIADAPAPPDSEEADGDGQSDTATKPPMSMGEAQRALAAVPGIDEKSGASILAEIGPDMSPFATARNLASWSKLCPGTNESAGKRRNSRTGKGSRWLRATLTQCAWAASHTKNTYFSALYRRLAHRRGKKRALIAVAHAILTTIYHILRDHRAFYDLGADYFDTLDKARIIRYHVRRLRAFGHNVTLEPNDAVA